MSAAVDIAPKLGAPWTQQLAIDLCRRIEAICPTYGCHVALTGGLLYKDGERKDADLVFYRIRQVERIDVDGLFEALEGIGIVRVTESEAFCIKAVTRAGRRIDCFFPEVASGDYPADLTPAQRAEKALL